MPISLYSASVPVFQHMLGNLSHILEKGQAHAVARKFDPAVLTGCRLAPDMLPLARQVLIACDAAKNGIMRVSGVEAPRFEDKETTFPELQARIRKTLDYLQLVPPETVDGKEEREITFPVGQEHKRTMTAQAYLTTWALPNFFFHLTTTYAILRHNGVELGKADYLVGPQR